MSRHTPSRNRSASSGSGSKLINGNCSESDVEISEEKKWKISDFFEPSNELSQQNAKSLKLLIEEIIPVCCPYSISINIFVDGAKGVFDLHDMPKCNYDEAAFENWCIQFLESQKASNQLLVERSEIATCKLTKEGLSRYFNCIKSSLNELYNIEANKYFHFKNSKRLFCCACTELVIPSNDEHSSAKSRSIFCCINGEGRSVEPLIISKKPNCEDSNIEFHKGGYFKAHSSSGDLTANLFYDWLLLLDRHIKDLRLNKPIILFYKGDPSLITWEAVDLARTKRIVLSCLPIHSGYILNPFQRTVFPVLKSKFLQKPLCSPAKMNDETFERAFIKAYSGIDMEELALKAFNDSGLCPIEANICENSVKLSPEKSSKAEIATNVSFKSPKVVTLKKGRKRRKRRNCLTIRKQHRVIKKENRRAGFDVYRLNDASLPPRKRLKVTNLQLTETQKVRDLDRPRRQGWRQSTRNQKRIQKLSKRSSASLNSVLSETSYELEFMDITNACEESFSTLPLDQDEIVAKVSDEKDALPHSLLKSPENSPVNGFCGFSSKSESNSPVIDNAANVKLLNGLEAVTADSSVPVKDETGKVVQSNGISFPLKINSCSITYSTSASTLSNASSSTVSNVLNSKSTPKQVTESVSNAHFVVAHKAKEENRHCQPQQDSIIGQRNQAEKREVQSPFRGFPREPVDRHCYHNKSISIVRKNLLSHLQNSVNNKKLDKNVKKAAVSDYSDSSNCSVEKTIYNVSKYGIPAHNPSNNSTIKGHEQNSSKLNLFKVPINSLKPENLPTNGFSYKSFLKGKRRPNPFSKWGTSYSTNKPVNKRKYQTVMPKEVAVEKEEMVNNLTLIQKGYHLALENVENIFGAVLDPSLLQSFKVKYKTNETFEEPSYLIWCGIQELKKVPHS